MSPNVKNLVFLKAAHRLLSKPTFGALTPTPASETAMMRLSTLLPLATTVLLASANPVFPNLFPSLFPSLFPAGPVGSIVSTALATAPIPSAVVPVVASAVASSPITSNNASTDTISGLDIPPNELYDNILAVITILEVVLTLLNATGLANVESVETRDLDLPISGLPLLQISGSLGGTITTLVGLTIPLLSTSADY